MTCASNVKDVNMSMVSLAVYSVLMALMDAVKKPYCFPKQSTILHYLRKWRGMNITRRTLNYHLKKLEFFGLITRKRRHFKDASGQLVLRSTLYFLHTIKHKSLKFLVNIAKRFYPYSAVQIFAQYPSYKEGILRGAAKKDVNNEANPPPDTARWSFPSDEVKQFIKKLR